MWQTNKKWHKCKAEGRNYWVFRIWSLLGITFSDKPEWNGWTPSSAVLSSLQRTGSELFDPGGGGGGIIVNWILKDIILAGHMFRITRHKF